jgi:hypothetical protein
MSNRFEKYSYENYIELKRPDNIHYRKYHCLLDFIQTYSDIFGHIRTYIVYPLTSNLRSK